MASGLAWKFKNGFTYTQSVRLLLPVLFSVSTSLDMQANLSLVYHKVCKTSVCLLSAGSSNKLCSCLICVCVFRVLREQWIRAKYERKEFEFIEKQEPYSAGMYILTCLCNIPVRNLVHAAFFSSWFHHQSNSDWKKTWPRPLNLNINDISSVKTSIKDITVNAFSLLLWWLINKSVKYSYKYRESQIGYLINTV